VLCNEYHEESMLCNEFDNNDSMEMFR